MSVYEWVYQYCNTLSIPDRVKLAILQWLAAEVEKKNDYEQVWHGPIDAQPPLVRDVLALYLKKAAQLELALAGIERMQQDLHKLVRGL